MTIAEAPQQRVGETPYEVIYTENSLQLRRYEPPERCHQTPILVVYALINRPYVLDLETDRSVIQRLLSAGFVVYLVDWGEPTRLDGHLGLSDYAGRLLRNCREAALNDAGASDCHLLGYCMGGTIAAVHAALDTTQIRTLTTVAAPIAFDGKGGILELWATSIDIEPLLQRVALVPGQLLARVFAAVDPIENTVGKLTDLATRSGDAAAIATFLRIERWIWDSVDVPRKVFRDFVIDLYSENKLATGRLKVAGQRIDLGDIGVPHQHIVGEADDLVPPASTRPLAAAIDNHDGRVVEFPAGHVGLSVSARAHDDLWPGVATWLAERSVPVETPTSDESVVRTASGSRNS
ncbi:MAG: alpha/beta fold hydrolase [Salinirussus sp.]